MGTMRKKELLLHEIEHIPNALLDELLDYVEFLKLKTARKRMGDTIASEASLKRDWLKAEEDEAWKSL